MKSESQIRVLYLLRYLYQHTDEDHPVTAADIVRYWEKAGIQASRKSVYQDIALLTDFGVDIVCVKSTQNKYFLASRPFELPELKLLVDAVESSRFITSSHPESTMRGMRNAIPATPRQKRLRILGLPQA